MEVFQVDAAHATSGIWLSNQPYLNITVGSGPKYQFVAVKKSDFPGRDVLLSRCSVERWGKERTLMIVGEKPEEANDGRCLVLASIEGGYNGGTVWPSSLDEGIKVLATGFTRQPTGPNGHVVKLLIMKKGTSFRVVREGRLYGQPAARYVYWDGTVLHTGTREEVFLDKVS